MMVTLSSTMGVGRVVPSGAPRQVEGGQLQRSTKGKDINIIDISYHVARSLEMSRY